MATKTPAEVINAAMNAGQNKLRLQSSDYSGFIILTMLAGAYIAFGGILSVIVGYGFPGITAENPAMQKLLSGAMFPIGLILVVVLGAELFTLQQRPAHASADGEEMHLARRCCQLGTRISRQLPRRDPVCLCHGIFRGSYRVGAISLGDYRYSESQSVDAVACGNGKGHRGKLVCMPCHMACTVGQEQRCEDVRVLASGDGVCRPRLRAFHSKHVLYTVRHARRCRRDGMADDMAQPCPRHYRQYYRRRAACGMCPHIPPFQEIKLTSIYNHNIKTVIQ